MTFSCVFLLLIVPSMESRHRKSDTHVELIYANTYTSVERLRSDVNRYVWWYDHQRLHSTLGYMSPVEFTQQGNTLQEQSNTPLPIHGLSTTGRESHTGTGDPTPTIGTYQTW